MVNATPDPRSFGSEDTHTIHTGSAAGQFTNSAAYIESLLANWPAPTPQQQRTVSHLLANATQTISVADYQSWQMKRHEDAGKHGYYTADGEAA
ncbi:hypothetical protein ACFYLX_03645 [Pseudarthrobacter enclensis]|uniref:hypothetical protein n=1 Tax=Pseudarthrobacter enclensis TaxID=993070 RepID=UPI003674452F